MIVSPHNLDRTQVEQLVRDALRGRMNGAASRSYRSAHRPASHHAAPHHGAPNPLVVNVSARHAHVTDDDLEVLFGPHSRLTKQKDLYQQGEFASEQTVNLVVPGSPRNRMIPNVRILGPTRGATQVELSYTDGVFLGMDLPLRISGNHQNTPGCVLVGPHGGLTIHSGVIRAARHVHMNPDDLAHYGVRDGDEVKLRIDGPCGLTLDHVVVRENPKVKLEVHIDTDEGNACDLKSADRMELVV